MNDYQGLLALVSAINEHIAMRTMITVGLFAVSDKDRDSGLLRAGYYSIVASRYIDGDKRTNVIYQGYSLIGFMDTLMNIVEFVKKNELDGLAISEFVMRYEAEPKLEPIDFSAILPIKF